MSHRFRHAADQLHSAFNNLFTGGSEHRNMTHSEASAALLKLAYRCTDSLNILTASLLCPWSHVIMNNAFKLKNDLLIEYGKYWNTWKKEAAMEKIARASRVDFHVQRTTLSKISNYRIVVEEESELMESIEQFKTLTTYSPVHLVNEDGRTIAMKIAKFISTLIGIVDKTGSIYITQMLLDPIIYHIRQVTVHRASNKQKFEIVNKLQSKQISRLSAGEPIYNQTLYVISHIGDTDNYVGFAFVDCSVDVAAGDKTDARITYIEIDKGYRNMSLGRELIHWIKITARDNGYTSLSCTAQSSNPTFWIKCGFYIQGEREMVLCSTNMMRIENIVN